MMVQGHTVDVLLSNDHRIPDSPFYAAWLFLRGLTAPIFMFTAGTVFIYLLRLINEPFAKNPRVLKGLKRFLLLVALGYLLRYPTSTIVDFSDVTEEGWNIFLAVDVLQLIGFSLLLLLICVFIAERTRISDYKIFIVTGAFFFLAYPFMERINWIEILPQFFAGYFYSGTGSLFPLFPWAGYVIVGGALGSYLAKNPLVFKTPAFSLKLLIAGTVFIFCSFFIYPVEEIFYEKLAEEKSGLETIFFRSGFVLVLNALISYISIGISYMPRIIILIGRNTLLIYVVHLAILYGSAWNPGLYNVFAKSFGIWNTIGTALLMILLMVGMVVVVNKLKIRNKQLVT